MNRKFTSIHLPVALILGSIWGLSEVALGVGLRSCAHTVSGSLMTGVALFFIAASWVAARNYYTPVLVVLIASAFKLFDAVLLNDPVMSGSIGNPVFAFLMEGLAFIVHIAIFRKAAWEKTSSRALLGGGAALIAVALFPLVKFATGVPACTYAGTTVPLSIYFAPVAIAFSALTVPLAFLSGDRIVESFNRLGLQIKNSLLRNMLSPATLVLCLALVFLFRLVVEKNFY